MQTIQLKENENEKIKWKAHKLAQNIWEKF